MNRETKIGMLTGLAVIVLVGVLLSQYFEHDNNARDAAVMSDVGSSYRMAMQHPAAVPSPAPVAQGQVVALAPVDSVPPVAFAAQGDGLIHGPMVMAAATPQAAPADAPAAPVTGDASLTGAAPANGIEPVTYVAQGDPLHPAPAALTGGTAAAAPVPASQQYTIAKGDSLTTISKKFYHSATKADFARIIAANSVSLKDEKTPLVAGKKLTIPGVAVAAAPAPAHGGPTSGQPAHGPVQIQQPKVTTYTVKQGDTIPALAAKLMGSRSADAQHKLMAYNNIKDAKQLKAGQILKVPAVATAVAAHPAPVARG